VRDPANESFLRQLKPDPSQRKFFSTQHLAADGDGSRTTAVVALSSHNLVVPGRAQVHSSVLPCVEVVGKGNGSSSALVLADRPELLEGCSTDDGWLVGTGGLQDVISRAIRGNRTLLLSTGGWVVCAEVLNNIVLDERVLSPAVDGEVAVAIRAVVTAVGDDPASTSWVPSLSANQVAIARPLNTVLTTCSIGVSSLSSIIRPP